MVQLSDFWDTLYIFVSANLISVYGIIFIHIFMCLFK